jgi:tetraacyldisaccharide 4'-kinase
MNAPYWWWTQGAAGPPLYLWPAWPLLLAAEGCYKTIIAARNASYDSRQQGGTLFTPPLPTISIGNIGIGGTGKTPVTIWLAGMLWTKGRRPAIIARGYGAAPSALNDELELAMRKCPYAAVLASPDRRKALRDAVAIHGAGVAILDDAFQHRRVRRDLDIALVDATRSFGNGHMLPAGPLREPIRSLARADVVLLTRAEQASPGHLDALGRRIAAHAGRDLPVGRIRFLPSGLTDLQFAPADVPGGSGGAFAGIANFLSFMNTCRQHELDVVARMPLADHVRYDDAVCDQICRWARTSGLSWLVTTEKDAVKLCRIGRDWPVPIRVLSIRVVPDEHTRMLLEKKVDSLLSAGPRG